jgi:hypothetical protein
VGFMRKKKKNYYAPPWVCDMSDPNEDCMQKLHPWEVDVSTTSIRASKPFIFSYFEVRVLDFPYVEKALRASL